MSGVGGPCRAARMAPASANSSCRAAGSCTSAKLSSRVRNKTTQAQHAALCCILRIGGPPPATRPHIVSIRGVALALPARHGLLLASIVQVQVLRLEGKVLLCPARSAKCGNGWCIGHAQPPAWPRSGRVWAARLRKPRRQRVQGHARFASAVQVGGWVPAAGALEAAPAAHEAQDGRRLLHLLSHLQKIRLQQGRAACH